MRYILGLVALSGLAVAAQVQAGSGLEARAIERFLEEQEARLVQQAADLEADWSADGQERDGWTQRLRALQNELRLAEDMQGRRSRPVSRSARLDQIEEQVARLDLGLRLGLPPTEVVAPTCGAASRVTTGTGSITGSVRRADNNLPVPNALVYVYDCLGRYMTSDFTDSAGTYLTTSMLSTGQYYVGVLDNPAGLINKIYPNVTCVACPPSVGSPVAVTDGGTTSGIDFALAPGSVFQGSVREAGGAGIAAAVYVGTPEGRVAYAGATDAAGVFVTYWGVPAGEYVVFTSATGNYVNECYPDLSCPTLGSVGDIGLPRVSASGTSAVTGLDIVLTPGGRIVGTVTDTALAPLAGVTISAGPDNGDVRCTTTTDASGAYECKGLLAGAYVLRAAKAGYVTQLFLTISCVGCTTRAGVPLDVAGGSTHTLPNIPLATEGAISGTVREGTGPGAPVAAATVSVHGPRGVLLASALTDASGNYFIGRLTSGNYYLRATAPGFVQGLYPFGPCPGCAVTAANAMVSVTAGATSTGRDLVVAREAGLAGTVTAAAGAPLANVSVLAYDVTGRLMSQGLTDCQGHYAINGLDAGAYYVHTSSNLALGGSMDEAAGGTPCLNCAPTSGTPVPLSVGVTTTLDFVLDPGGYIAGRIADSATGRALSNQIVAVFDASGVFRTSSISNALGRYTTSTLAAGNYTIQVEPYDGYRRQVYGAAPCDLACVPTSGTPIVVAAGPVTIDIALQRGGRISGRVLSGTWGTPVVGATVVVYASTGGFATSVPPHSSGTFTTMVGLPPGTYNLVDQGASGYIPQRYGGGDCFPLASCTPGTTGVVVAGTATSTIPPLALTQGARLAGRMGTSLGPASSAGVLLYSATGTQVASTTAETSGLFRFIPGLPAGTYFLRSRATSLGYTDRLYVGRPCTALACVVTSGDPLTIAGSGGFVNLDLGGGKATKGDLDRNLNTDLVLRNQLTNEHAYWLMAGTTRFASGNFSPALPASPSQGVAGVDDFDSDGLNDLVFWNSSSGAVEFWLMNGVTRLGAPVPMVTPAPAPSWRLSATADFDRDGNPDLLWRNFVTQKIEIWRMAGVTRTSTVIPTPDQAVDGNWEIVATLDWNGDGYVDFLWYNPTSGKIVAWFMDAAYKRVTGMFTTPANAGDNNWRVVAGGDYGVGAGGLPGTLDIVWRNATSGNLVVWHMNQRAERTAGLFTTPAAPSPALDWNIVGPR